MPEAVPTALAAALLLSACTSDPRPAAAGRGASAAALPNTAAGTESGAGAPAPLTLAPGTFAFADASGTRLLALEDVATPAAMRAAICAGAPARPVVADGRQPTGTHDSGRQTAANFSEQAGARFRVSGAPVPAGESCYLTADAALVAGLLPFTPPPTPSTGTRRPARPAGGCDTTLTAPVAAARARPVAQCWPLGAVPGGPTMFVVRFVTRDTNALARLVALDGAARWYHDFPAVDHGNGESVWRLDDGGVFPADAMRIRFVSRVRSPVRGVLLVGMTWDGTEGETAYLLAADFSGTFRTLTQTYRYTAPM
ncbi:MAG: hypothetical protein ACK54K_17960 [Gemmatimonadaceae bacterium]